MTQVKSEKARELINNKSLKQDIMTSALILGDALMGDNYTYVIKSDAKRAIILAEIEAEERHANDLQALKDKAVVEIQIATGKPLSEINWILNRIFTQKLNEQ